MFYYWFDHECCNNDIENTIRNASSPSLSQSPSLFLSYLCNCHLYHHYSPYFSKGFTLVLIHDWAPLQDSLSSHYSSCLPYRYRVRLSRKRLVRKDRVSIVCEIFERKDTRSANKKRHEMSPILVGEAYELFTSPPPKKKEYVDK